MNKQASSPVFYTPKNYSPLASVAYLILRAKSAYQRAGDLKLERLGITAAQMSVLMIISHGNQSSITSVSHALGVDPAATVRIVQKLEQMKLIQKIPSANDRRVIELSLSPDGLKMCKSISPIWCDLLNQSLTGFNAKEFEQFREFLLRVEKNNLMLVEGVE